MKQSASERRSRLPWVVLAVMIAVIAGVTLYRQFVSLPAQQIAASATENAANGKTQIRRLSPEQLRALAAKSPGQTGAMPAMNMTEMLEKRKRMTAATQARIQQRNSAMSSRFSAEKNDPAWSGAHEKDLASLQDSEQLREATAKPTNFQAECRSSMCRIQGDFPNAGMAADWLQLYMGSVGDRLPVATAHQIRNQDGSVRIEIYGVGRKN